MLRSLADVLFGATSDAAHNDPGDPERGSLLKEYREEQAEQKALVDKRRARSKKWEKITSQLNEEPAGQLPFYTPPTALTILGANEAVEMLYEMSTELYSNEATADLISTLTKLPTATVSGEIPELVKSTNTLYQNMAETVKISEVKLNVYNSLSMEEIEEKENECDPIQQMPQPYRRRLEFKTRGWRQYNPGFFSKHPPLEEEPLLPKKWTKEKAIERAAQKGLEAIAKNQLELSLLFIPQQEGSSEEKLRQEGMILYTKLQQQTLVLSQNCFSESKSIGPILENEKQFQDWYEIFCKIILENAKKKSQQTMPEILEVDQSDQRSLSPLSVCSG